MTDIYGHPEPRYIHVPVYPHSPRPIPFPGLSLLVTLYAVVACLYVIGWLSAFPRSGGHDAILAVAFGLSVVAWPLWELVKKIPYVGTVIYLLPGVSLIAVPFALDFYLMYRH